MIHFTLNLMMLCGYYHYYEEIQIRFDATLSDTTRVATIVITIVIITTSQFMTRCVRLLSDQGYAKIYDAVHDVARQIL